jgi:Domain of unknown function (DUF4524)
MHVFCVFTLRSCFTQITEQGGCRQQLTRFCTSQLLPQVSAALHFRNQHSAQPYICSRVHAETAVRCNAAPSTYAYWTPACDSRYVAQSTDGSIAVEAIHGNAKLVLAASTASVTVSWDAEVSSEGKSCLTHAFILLMVNRLIPAAPIALFSGALAYRR